MRKANLVTESRRHHKVSQIFYIDIVWIVHLCRTLWYVKLLKRHLHYINNTKVDIFSMWKSSCLK